MKLSNTIFLLALALTLNSCGDSAGEKNEDEASTEPTSNQNGTPLTASAKFSVGEAVYSLDNGEYEVDTYKTCKKDLSTGLLSIRIGNSENYLDLQVKNVSNAAKNYSCRQAENNKTGEDSLGDLFYGCGVEVHISPNDEDGIDGYSMYRNSTDLSPFSYDGVCGVSISEVDDSVKGSVECYGMAQTFLESSYRNPIDAGVNAEVMGDFECVLVKK